jgi:hypothetical protein
MNREMYRHDALQCKHQETRSYEIRAGDQTVVLCVMASNTVEI